MQLHFEKCLICQTPLSPTDKRCGHCRSPYILAVNFFDVNEREEYKNNLAEYRRNWKTLLAQLEKQLAWDKENWYRSGHWEKIWQHIVPAAAALGFDEPSTILLARFIAQQKPFRIDFSIPEETPVGDSKNDDSGSRPQLEIADWVGKLPDAEYSVVEWVNFVKSIDEIANFDKMTELLVQEISRRFVTFETISVDKSGNLFDQRQRTTKSFIETLNRETEILLINIPPGSFEMGCEDWHHTRPVHRVEISEFYLGAAPVTQKQWAIVAGFPKVDLDISTNPSYFSGENLPVDSVSWMEAVEFCRRLAQRTGRKYRLPTEAEWEYAARAGSPTAFAYGATITPFLANYNGEFPFGESLHGLNRGKTTPAGSLAANEFGLTDMHGNVWEWCADWYSPRF